MQKLLAALTGLSLMVLVMSGCGAPAAPATIVAPSATAVSPSATPLPPTPSLMPLTATPMRPTATPIPPTATPVPPTAIPIPATPTPVPTNTPIPTPDPRYPMPVGKGGLLIRNLCVRELVFRIFNMASNDRDTPVVPPLQLPPNAGEVFVVLDTGTYTSVISVPNDGGGGGPQWTTLAGKLVIIQLSVDSNRNLLASKCGS